MTPAPPGRTRRLGRSRTFTGADLPDKLRHWHAPRANRWERLVIVRGALDVEWLDATGIANEHLATGEQRWIVPGRRWRVAALPEDAGFELEVHADETIAPAAPQLRRAVVLDEAPVATIANASDIPARVAAIAPGARQLWRMDSDAAALLQQALHDADGPLSWHPLEASPPACVALVARSAQPLALTEYLSRDHAVIEAELVGALRGDAEHILWLANALARHLAFEENLLFPAYLEAGGNQGWVRGLLNEHKRLRAHLPNLDDTTARRQLSLLLDGHDEKEERVVYPDIVAHLADRAADFAHQLACYPLAAASD